MNHVEPTPWIKAQAEWQQEVESVAAEILRRGDADSPAKAFDQARRRVADRRGQEAAASTMTMVKAHNRDAEQPIGAGYTGMAGY